MKIIIRKNKHYPFFLFCLPFPIWFWKKKTTQKKRYFKFTESCLYDLKDEDQLDINKLFGFSIGHHHKQNSFRFGWRSNLNSKEIEIFTYEYHNGIRQKPKHLCNLELDNKYHRFHIIYNPITQSTFYNVDNTFFCISKFSLNKKHGLGYSLEPYFGGNEEAPHDIIFYRKRKM